MQPTSEPQNRLAAEIKIIPTWAYILAACGFIAEGIFFMVLMAHEPDPLNVCIRVGLAILLGGILACYLLILGYISNDAKRRGMSRLLWMLVAILIPNGLGILLYFVLRQRLPDTFASAGVPTYMPATPEPGCCPRCGYKLTAVCPQCQRTVAADDTFCKHCGTALQPQTVPA
jgi:hypothetical protein